MTAEAGPTPGPGPDGSGPAEGLAPGGGALPDRADRTDVAGIPDAASRRLTGGAWSSGLSVADFASCVQMGLRPVGFVQGYAVMQWSWYMATRMGAGFGAFGPGVRWWQQQQEGQYLERWNCPHGYVGAEHRLYGVNVEQTWLEQSWAGGWDLARSRMIEEATALGASGVIAVSDDVRPLLGPNTLEFRSSGTAVVVDGAPPPKAPFTTYLAGQRLAKLFEAGFSPVSVVATLASVQMIGYCITHYQLAGTAPGTWFGSGAGGVAGVAPVEQVNRAHAATRRLAREHLRRRLGPDHLHGATMEQSEREVGEGDLVIDCLVKGNRVRRFKDFDPLPEPAPVVPLS